MKKMVAGLVLWAGIAQAQQVSVVGNTWATSGDVKISEKGIQTWKDGEAILYFSVQRPGSYHLYLYSEGVGELEVTVGEQHKSAKWKNAGEVDLGEYVFSETGYHHVKMKGSAPQLQYLRLTGPEDVKYVKDEFYWGRRGPSVHLSYEMPTNQDIEWIYNEITVPEGEDVIGSYYMANGFAEGYFGIQVNSAKERRILFSVWSPYSTDDPSAIPADQRIELLRKGDDVVTGEFGNEGSGGQSFRRYAWVAGNTYGFLTRIRPSDVEGSTEYTAYFYAPEEGKWQLMASFRRPKTVTYAKRFHSFLENFITETGNKPREVHFSNAWVKSTAGVWTEMTRAKFTADATARKENRLDYAGGVKGKLFFLKNCGFFSPSVLISSFFEREAGKAPPHISWAELK
jgi:hypothetical protein